MKVLYLIFILSLFWSNISSANLKELLQDNPTNEEFLSESDWFELKDFFYKMNKLSTMEFTNDDQMFQSDDRQGENFQEDDSQHNPQQQQRDIREEYRHFADLARERLEALKIFRKEKMLEILNNLITGGEGAWVDHSTDFYNANLREQFSEIIHLFSGNKKYLVKDEKIYLFNFFGSETPTSDLDYGLYILTVHRKDMQFFDELAKVDQTNSLIVNAAREFLKYLGRENEQLQNLLDINGYPDMFVMYQYFFRMNSLNVMGSQLDWVFQNYFSNIMLRICLSASIHPYRRWLDIKKVDWIKDQEDLIQKCYELFMGIRDEFLVRHWKNAELVPEETRAQIIEGKAFIRRDSDFEQFLFIGRLFQAYDNTYSWWKDSQVFKKTIHKNSSPAEVFDLVKLDSTPQEVVYQEINFVNYQSIFFIEKEEKDKLKSLKTFTLPNQIYMSFISSSFSLASEAYCTIGALEYVKFQKTYEQKQNLIKWVSLFEVFLDNFGMILSHISHDTTHLLVDIQDHQPASDIFSKYLKRAMAFLRLNSLNSYDIQINRLFTGDLSAEITNHWIFAFYMEIVDYDGNDKKQFYFDKLKTMSPNERIDKILADAFEFYKLVYHFLLDNFDAENVVFKSSRRLILT